MPWDLRLELYSLPRRIVPQKMTPGLVPPEVKRGETRGLARRPKSRLLSTGSALPEGSASQKRTGDCCAGVLAPSPAGHLPRKSLTPKKERKEKRKHRRKEEIFRCQVRPESVEASKWYVFLFLRSKVATGVQRAALWQLTLSRSNRSGKPPRTALTRRRRTQAPPFQDSPAA